MNDSVKYYMEHFNPEISDEIKAYATDQVFLKSRYLFTRRQGKHQFAYCTHCRVEFDSTENKLKHQPVERNIYSSCCHMGYMSMPPPPPPAEVFCPNCGSKCVVKSSGISHKYLDDSAYFIVFDKSIKDPGIVVARGFLAYRDYSMDYHNVETKYLEVTRYVFEMGGSKMFSTAGYYWGKRFRRTDPHWFQRKSVFEDTQCRSSLGHYVSMKSLENAVAKTQFQYSCWDFYLRLRHDMIKFLDLYSRYPCIEYLTKFGFQKIVTAKLTDDHTHGAVNWNGKSIFKVLRLNKAEIKEIKSYNIDLDCFLLYLIQLSKKDGSIVAPAEIAALKLESYRKDIIKEMLKYVSFRKMINYIQKQVHDSKHYKNGDYVLSDWSDYMRECKHLNLNIEDLSVVFPRNLRKAHQNLTKQIKIKADQELQKKIKEAAKLVKNLHFEYQGLLIRPAQTADELITEGKSLNHCVGTYARDFASGMKVILFIRKKENPDMPYYTVELRGKSIIQVRGDRNCPANEEVQRFIDAFKAAKLTDKREQQRIRVPA